MDYGAIAEKAYSFVDRDDQACAREVEDERRMIYPGDVEGFERG